MVSSSPSGSGGERRHDGSRSAQPVPGRCPAQRCGSLRAAAPAPPAALQPHRRRLPRCQAVRGRGGAGLCPAAPRCRPLCQSPHQAGPSAAGRVLERDGAGGAHRQQDERGDQAVGHQTGRPIRPGHHSHPQALPHRQPQHPGPVAPPHQQTLRPHCSGPTPPAPIKPPTHVSASLSPLASRETPAHHIQTELCLLPGGMGGCA